jgi:hypothetical protein
MKKHLSPFLFLCFGPLLTACVGTTGGGLVDFDAYASGPTDASGAPGAAHSYVFQSPYTRYTITLTKATLQIGAVYLDASPCSGSSEILPCVDQNAATVAQVNGGVLGAYGASQTSGVLLDTLSADPQPFATGGSGIIQQALSAEVWLSAGTVAMAIDDVTDASVIADIEGKAEKDGTTIVFSATVTISQNRLLPITNPALPGLNPICEQRIVRPICLTPPVEPEAGTSFHVQVDPKGWFDNVDFSLANVAPGATYQIPDDNDDVNGHNLLQGIESSSGVYSFTFQMP